MNDEGGQREILSQGPPARSRLGRVRLGMLLIVVSSVLWLPLPVVPFLPLSTADKAMLAGALFVGVQIAWWGGLALAGPEAARATGNWFRNRLRWQKAASGDTDPSSPSV